MGTTADRSDFAAAVRAVVDTAPALTAETVQRIGQIMRSPLALPVDTDAGGVEPKMSA